MRINCRYVNSQGAIVDFLGEKSRVTAGNLHGRTWKPAVTAGTIGETVNYWKKEAYSITLTVTFRGSRTERLREIDRAQDCFEYDILHNAPGTLYYGDWFCRCFITSAEYSAGDLPTWIDEKINVYVPAATWWHIQTYRIVKQVDSGISTAYPTIYPFTYEIDKKEAVFENEHFTDTDCRMIIYGPANNVNITISGTVYKVDHQILEREYLVIDTRDKLLPEEHCYLVRSDGSKVNCYNDRKTDIMQKLPSGSISVNYSRDYTVELQLLHGRSEPRWYQ
ncbi:MAG: hypothetical protein Q4B85_06690 [Lachnospiraceae bacterium]|nr:hypothetical protein [Lachnospiraceae bacterium]